MKKCLVTINEQKEKEEKVVFPCLMTSPAGYVYQVLSPTFAYCLTCSSTVVNITKRFYDALKPFKGSITITQD